MTPKNSDDLLDAMRFVIESFKPMPYYYLDSKGLHKVENLPDKLEIGTIIGSTGYRLTYLIVHKYDAQGKWCTERAHTKHIQRIKTALLIEGVSI